MRKGRNNSILVDNNVLLGVNLGADHCAEHEWGIKNIKSRLGIDDSKMGLAKRIVSSGPEEIKNGRLRFVENHVIGKGKTKTKWSGIAFDSFDNDLWYLNTYIDSDLLSFWNEHGFCVVSSNKENIAQLKEIFEAFKTNDVAIWLGGGGVFQNAGLALGIVSRLPKDITDNWLKHDEEVAELQRLTDESGIEKILKDADKGYFCLSPKFDSNGELIFWLNPMKQDINHYGWYNIDELKLWAENKGPVLEKRKRA